MFLAKMATLAPRTKVPPLAPGAAVADAVAVVVSVTVTPLRTVDVSVVVTVRVTVEVPVTVVERLVGAMEMLIVMSRSPMMIIVG